MNKLTLNMHMFLSNTGLTRATPNSASVAFGASAISFAPLRLRFLASAAEGGAA